MAAERVEDICNYFEITGLIGTAGQPGPDQFAGIRAAGYELVINLAMPDSTNALSNERELVLAQRMDYVHLPVVWEQPTDQDLDAFFEYMRQYEGKKILVHCALNYRVSCFMLLYRVIHQGVSPGTAWQAVRAIWEPNDIWQEFISRSLARWGIEP